MVLQYSFLHRFMKSWKSMSDEWLNAIFWSSYLFGIFIIKYCVECSVIFFDAAKYDNKIKVREMFSFLLLINNSVATGLSFLWPIISAIILSKTINI